MSNPFEEGIEKILIGKPSPKAIQLVAKLAQRGQDVDLVILLPVTHLLLDASLHQLVADCSQGQHQPARMDLLIHRRDLLSTKHLEFGPRLQRLETFLYAPSLGIQVFEQMRRIVLCIAQ